MVPHKCRVLPIPHAIANSTITMTFPLRKLLLVPVVLAVVLPAAAADWLDFLKPKPAPTSSSAASAPASLAGLSQDQMVSGLKEALDKGVQHAIAALGKPDGFLKDLRVKIPMPEKLQTSERTLRTLGQDKLADDFVTTMNRAAEQAVPEAAAVLGDSVRQLSVADAKAILTGTNNAATQFFRRTSETNLYARFLPIVRTATETAGVTSAYKKMTDKAAGGFGGLGGFASGLLAKEAPDLDSYVTRKALDGLFVKIGDEEQRIRENPVARTTELLKTVFGAVGK